MLARPSQLQKLHTHSRQKGVVLLITLIMLVAMTLATIAMMRSVDTTNLIAGNLAFQQTSFHAADTGTEQAIAYLYNSIIPNQTCLGTTLATPCPNGYQSYHDPALEPSPASPGVTWASYWNSMRGGPGVVALTGLPSGYSGAFVIEALCTQAGMQGQCGTATTTSSTTPPQGQDMGSTVIPGNSTTSTSYQYYYRITTRIEGPRNSVGYVQAYIAL